MMDSPSVVVPLPALVATAGVTAGRAGGATVATSAAAPSTQSATYRRLQIIGRLPGRERRAATTHSRKRRSAVHSSRPAPPAAALNLASLPLIAFLAMAGHPGISEDYDAPCGVSENRAVAPATAPAGFLSTCSYLSTITGS